MRKQEIKNNLVEYIVDEEVLMEVHYISLLKICLNLDLDNLSFNTNISYNKKK